MKNEINCLIIIVVLGVISYNDIKFQRIPNSLLIILGIIGVVLRCFFKDMNLFLVLSDSLPVSLMMFFILFFSKKSFGSGDIKLMMASGILLGYRKNMEAFVIAMLLTVLIGGMQIVRKKKNLKDSIPLGPMFSIGIILCYIDVYF